MRKIVFLLIACFLLTGSYAFATENPASQAAEMFGLFRGPDGTTSPVRIVKVRYGYQSANQSGLSSGDVVIWDTTSHDGYTISGCITNADNTYAGVLVTDLATADNSTVRGDGDNVGYMAIQGYCLAKVDTSAATAGQKLVVNGSTLVTSFATTTADAGSSSDMSGDVGVLLQNTSSDGLMPVWLR